MKISSAGYRCSQGSQPAVGPGGEVYVSWVTGTRAVVVRSTDGGLTWGSKSTIPMFPPPEIYGGWPRTAPPPRAAGRPPHTPPPNGAPAAPGGARLVGPGHLTSRAPTRAAPAGAPATR